MTNFSKPFSRRHFLQQSLIGAAGLTASSSVLPRRSDALEHRLATRYGGSPLDDVPITDDPRVRQLLHKGVDAAIAAGASYADMRLTHTRTRVLNSDSIGSVAEDKYRRLIFTGFTPTDEEEITVGVRAFVKGYWGFASGPVWSIAEADRLGREAARQASANSLGKTNEVALAPTDRVTGAWTARVTIDPFSIHPQQLKDILRGICVYCVNFPGVDQAVSSGTFERQDKAFCSSLGSYFTQRTYRAVPSLLIRYRSGAVSVDLEGFTDSAKGFEIFDEQRLRDAIEPLIAEADYERSLPYVPMDVGRYETVMDAATVRELLNGSIGAATELDRALGYEANAGGTSYLNDPIEMLGSKVIGSSLISVTADRSQPAGLATVQWDDEGVIPEATALVTRGTLSNYQTNRQGAAWLAASKPGFAARSSGGAFAPTGVHAPLVHTANLQLHPGDEAQDFASLVRGVKKGIAQKGGGFMMDSQQLNGFGLAGKFFEIENGKIVANAVGISPMFKSPEFWKGIIAIGGAGSRRTYGMSGTKGEPVQTGRHTISSVPVLHRSLTFIDMTRKA